MDDIEEWRDIAGYEGLYKLSNYGRVLGLERFTDEGKRLRKERILMGNQRAAAPTWIKVNLTDDFGIKTTFNLIQLMINTFNLHDPETTIIFKDGNMLNRRLSNIGFISRDDVSEEGEIWKPVPSFHELYDISSHGRIWRKPYVDENGRLFRGKLNTTNCSIYGNMEFKPSNSRINTSKVQQRAVWKIMCIAFTNKTPRGVLYKDGDHTNVKLENLVFTSTMVHSSIHERKRINLVDRKNFVGRSNRRTKFCFLVEPIIGGSVGYYSPNLSDLGLLLDTDISIIYSSFQRKTKEINNVAFIKSHRITRLLKSTTSNKENQT